MEKGQDEMWIPRYKGKSVMGNYGSVELIKAISGASPLKVHQSFLTLCTGPVTCHLHCSLRLLGKIQNNVTKCNTGLLSLKCYVFVCGDVFAELLQTAGRVLPGFLVSVF